MAVTPLLLLHLAGNRAEILLDLAKVGLSDRRVVYVDSGLCAMAPQSSGVIADVTPGTAMTA